MLNKLMEVVSPCAFEHFETTLNKMNTYAKDVYCTICQVLL